MTCSIQSESKLPSRVAVYSFNCFDQHRIHHKVERARLFPRRRILLIAFELSSCDRSVMYSSLYMHDTLLVEPTTGYATKVRWPIRIFHLGPDTDAIRVCTCIIDFTGLLLIARSFDMSRQEVGCSYTKPILKFHLPPSKLEEIMASPSSNTPSKKPRKKSTVSSVCIVAI